MQLCDYDNIFNGCIQTTNSVLKAVFVKGSCVRRSNRSNVWHYVHNHVHIVMWKDSEIEGIRRIFVSSECSSAVIDVREIQ